MKQFLILAAAGILLAQSAASAAVFNTGAGRYNWLLDERANSSTNGGNGFGTTGTAKASLSNAQRVWIPSAGVTLNGTNGYYGQVDLGEVRPINFLRTRTYHEAGITFNKLIAEFSDDGINFSNQQVLYDNPSVNVTSEFVFNGALSQTFNARYVRLEFPAGRYASTGANGYGGPGLYGIEPYSPVGTNVTLDNNFNYALNAYTGTNQVGTGFEFGSGVELGDGVMINDGARGGASNSWGTTKYLTVKLKELSVIREVRIDWNDGQWWSRGLTLEFSSDGIDYSFIPPVVLLDGNPMLGGSTDAARITFAPRVAQYVRWRNTTTSAQRTYTIAQEFAVYITVPEPASTGVLAIGGLALLRRRSRRGR